MASSQQPATVYPRLVEQVCVFQTERKAFEESSAALSPRPSPAPSFTTAAPPPPAANSNNINSNKPPPPDSPPPAAAIARAKAKQQQQQEEPPPKPVKPVQWPKPSLTDRRRCLQAEIVARAPDTSTVPPQLPLFAFPRGIRLLTERSPLTNVHSFVLTNEDGNRLYGYCYTKYYELDAEHLALIRAELALKLMRRPTNTSHQQQQQHRRTSSKQQTKRNSRRTTAEAALANNATGDAGTAAGAPASLPSPSRSLAALDEHAEQGNLGGGEEEPQEEQDTVVELPNRAFGPSCLCLLSRYAFHQGFLTALSNYVAAHAVNSNTPFSQKDADRIWSSCCKLVTPSPGKTIHLAWGKRNDKVALRLPAIKEPPLCDVDFKLLFRHLHPERVVDVITAMLNQQCVLLVTEHPALLSMCSEALLALIYPLPWPFVYISVLPEPLYGFLEMPGSFLIGALQGVQAVVPDHVLIVDLDAGLVSKPRTAEEKTTSLGVPGGASGRGHNRVPSGMMETADPVDGLSNNRRKPSLLSRLREKRKAQRESELPEILALQLITCVEKYMPVQYPEDMPRPRTQRQWKARANNLLETAKSLGGKRATRNKTEAARARQLTLDTKMLLANTGLVPNEETAEAREDAKEVAAIASAPARKRRSLKDMLLHQRKRSSNMSKRASNLSSAGGVSEVAGDVGKRASSTSAKPPPSNGNAPDKSSCSSPGLAPMAEDEEHDENTRPSVIDRLRKARGVAKPNSFLMSDFDALRMDLDDIDVAAGATERMKREKEGKCDVQALRDGFLYVFISLLRGYRMYVANQGKESTASVSDARKKRLPKRVEFESEAFVKQSAEPYQPFLTRLVSDDSQLFQYFLQERIQKSGRVVDYFDTMTVAVLRESVKRHAADSTRKLDGELWVRHKKRLGEGSKLRELARAKVLGSAFVRCAFRLEGLKLRYEPTGRPGEDTFDPLTITLQKNNLTKVSVPLFKGKKAPNAYVLQVQTSVSENVFCANDSAQRKDLLRCIMARVADEAPQRLLDKFIANEKIRAALDNGDETVSKDAQESLRHLHVLLGKRRL